MHGQVNTCITQVVNCFSFADCQVTASVVQKYPKKEGKNRMSVVNGKLPKTKLNASSMFATGFPSSYSFKGGPVWEHCLVESQSAIGNGEGERRAGPDGGGGSYQTGPGGDLARCTAPCKNYKMSGYCHLQVIIPVASLAQTLTFHQKSSSPYTYCDLHACCDP